MYQSNKISFFEGFKKSLPLVFSASFFGIIFGYTGANGQLPLSIISSSSFIIFAGAAQFISIILIIAKEEMLAIIVAALLINLRHLLYGAVIHDLTKFKGIKKLIAAYFLTDEAFLVTTLTEKQNQQSDLKFNLDYILLGSGITLWVFWNITTILGYLLYNVTSNLFFIPDNFVISASFIGYLVNHYIKYKQDRLIIILTSIMSLILGFTLNTSSILIIIMFSGAIFAIVFQKGGN